MPLTILQVGQLRFHFTVPCLYILYQNLDYTNYFPINLYNMVAAQVFCLLNYSSKLKDICTQFSCYLIHVARPSPATGGITGGGIGGGTGGCPPGGTVGGG